MFYELNNYFLKISRMLDFIKLYLKEKLILNL